MADDDWSIYEVLEPDADGQLVDHGSNRPVSRALAESGDPIETAISKLKLLEYHGWPAARGLLDVDEADDKTPKIWILKCKPSCWRFYFHVYETRRRIVLLHVRCKKRNRRSSSDSTRARNVLGALGARRSGIILFEFPPS
jgi:hypothetical protein